LWVYLYFSILRCRSPRYLSEESPDAFTLVLLSERFDEGLLLLRRLLNWDMRDVTYLRLLDSNLAGGM